MNAVWRRSERARSIVLVLGVSVLLWELACRFLGIREFVLPAPTAILTDLAADPRYFWRHAMSTLSTTLIGFGLAVLLGVIMAVGIVHSKLIERTLYTLLVALNSIPKVALAPIFVIWLGTGQEPKIAIALTIAIFSIVIDTVLGLRSVDPDMLNLARTGRAGRLQMLIRIRLPNALPSMFAGMKVGISFALVGAIVGEFVAGDRGLGQVILFAQGMFDTTRAFAALFLLGIMGTILFFVVEMFERLLLPWHVSQRSGHDAVGGHTL
jgi:NitT/TauT family transport system permease protein